MTPPKADQRELLAQLLSRGRREVFADWQARRSAEVPAARRLPAEDLRREDSELFDLVTAAVRTGATEGLARFATTFIEKRLSHQFLAEEMLAETMVLRRLCEERIPEGPDHFQALSILWQVFDAYVQELFRVTTEFLILRVEQRNVQLERFYSFSEVILNTMEDGVIVTDLHGRITKINRAARELLGFKDEEMIGAAAPYPFWKRSEQASTRNLVEECLRTGKVVHELDVAFSTRNGEIMSLPVHCVPVHNQAGDMSGALLVFRDLREMKRLAAELRRATLSRGGLAA